MDGFDIELGAYRVLEEKINPLKNKSLLFDRDNHLEKINLFFYISRKKLSKN